MCSPPSSSSSSALLGEEEGSGIRSILIWFHLLRQLLSSHAWSASFSFPGHFGGAPYFFVRISSEQSYQRQQKLLLLTRTDGRLIHGKNQLTTAEIGDEQQFYITASDPKAVCACKETIWWLVGLIDGSSSKRHTMWQIWFVCPELTWELAEGAENGRILSS